MVVPLLWPGIHYPDEVMQSLEQAHRLVFGNGLVPWEFRDGVRSWLLPVLLAGPMWLGDALAPATGAYRLLAQALIAALSASTVVIGYVWARQHGVRHAVLAAVVLSTWFELVYFGARAMGEVVATAFLFAGVFLCADRANQLDPPRLSCWILPRRRLRLSFPSRSGTRDCGALALPHEVPQSLAAAAGRRGDSAAGAWDRRRPRVVGAFRVDRQ